MKLEYYHRLTLLCCLSVAMPCGRLTAGTPGGTGVGPDMTAFSNARDYGCMYWLDGIKGQDFRIETSRYALNYNHRAFGPTALGVRVDAPGEAANLVAAPGRLPAAALSCKATIDGKEVAMSSASDDPRTSQIVESGRFFQRRWQPGSAAGIAIDAARTGLETAAWPDRLSMVFRFSPAVQSKKGCWK